MEFIKKDWKTFLIVIFVSIIFLSIGNGICSYKVDKKHDLDYYTARVISIDKEEKIDEDNRKIYFKSEVLSGPHKGKKVDCIQKIIKTDSYQPKDVTLGKLIILNPSRVIGYENQVTGDDIFWTFSQYKTSNYLIALLILFLAIILLIGKWKGLNTIIALVVTTTSIIMVFIPGVLKGYNIYVLTIIICTFITIASLLLINGYNKKTLCAIVGNIFGILAAGALALILNKLMHISGIIDEESVYLSLFNSSNPINMQALVWSGIVIGALGAIMDISMSIASAMNELNEEMKNKNFIKLFKSGMNVGKDAIGTMTNTLILAYIGASMSTVLLLFSYNKNLLYIFNIEMISVEVLQAIIGSIGILCAVPITAAFGSWLFNKKKEEN